MEELVTPDLVSVLPSVRTVNAIVEMGQAWGDPPLFEVSLRRDVLERFAQLGLDREQRPLPPSPSSSMNLLSWNSRGAGSRTFLRNIRDLIRVYAPEVIFVLETRISGTVAAEAIAPIGYGEKVVVDSVGRSGGMWMLWNPGVVNVRVLSQTTQKIDAIISF